MGNAEFPVCGEHEALGFTKCDCDQDNITGACWWTNSPAVAKDTLSYHHSTCNGTVGGRIRPCKCLCHKNNGVWADPVAQADVDAAIASIEMAVRARVTRGEPPKNTRDA